MLNEINKTRDVHILTIEDPVEFIFRPERSIISQREMRSDTHSWEIALRSALREDPDVVLVGEMRDYETIAAALTVAETGHLFLQHFIQIVRLNQLTVLSTSFLMNSKNKSGLQLSNTLEAVFSQRLIATPTKGRAVAYEVMLGTTAVKTAIREGKTHQIEIILKLRKRLE